MVTDVPAPLALTGSVRPEWIDYNGHVADSSYLLAFEESTVAMLELLGFGEAYLATGSTIFTAEAHLRFLRQVVAGDELRFRSLLLGCDEKRLHLHHALYVGADEAPAATCELLLLHVDHARGRVTPFPADVAAHLGAVRRAHAELPRPEGLRLEHNLARPREGERP
jgi:acyl-CoA thioester hydrolase